MSQLDFRALLERSLQHLYLSQYHFLTLAPQHLFYRNTMFNCLTSTSTLTLAVIRLTAAPLHLSTFIYRRTATPQNYG